MLLQIGTLLCLGSKCYYGWDFYYAWVQMLLKMELLLHLGPVITLSQFTLFPQRLDGSNLQVPGFFRRLPALNENPMLG